MRPDLVVMDARLPGMNGLRATEAILAELPSTMVVILTTYPDLFTPQDAEEAGASAFLTKDAPSELERIIERLHASLGPAPEGCGFGLRGELPVPSGG